MRSTECIASCSVIRRDFQRVVTLPYVRQKAQLSQRDRSMLRVIEYNFLVTQSLEVIRNGTIQKLGYGFLFAYSNYDCILYHFRDEARYWSKIAIFS